MRLTGTLVVLSLLLALSSGIRADNEHAILKAIHSDEVRHIMRRLNLLLFEREQTQLELQRLKQKQLQLLVEEARALTETASQIATIDSLQHLDDEQKLTFNAMAQQLYGVTRKLLQESEAGHREAVDEAYIELQETCNTCHLLFRSW